jgi:hypothetical protein
MWNYKNAKINFIENPVSRGVRTRRKADGMEKTKTCEVIFLPFAFGLSYTMYL